MLLQGGKQEVLMGDVHILPGMEGSPVMRDDIFVGILMTPLSHTRFDAEVLILIQASPYFNCKDYILHAYKLLGTQKT